jgi:hypothetical protein
MIARPRVLYVDHKNNGSVLFLEGWARQLEVTHVHTVLSAINLMGCQHFDFIVAEWSEGHRSGLRIIEFAQKLNLPCAIFTNDVHALADVYCHIWSKDSAEKIPNMIMGALCHPNRMVVDSKVMCAPEPMKTRIFKMFGHESKKEHV